MIETVKTSGGLTEIKMQGCAEDLVKEMLAIIYSVAYNYVAEECREEFIDDLPDMIRHFRHWYLDALNRGKEE